MAERSRVERYAYLRRKIENGSYFSLRVEDSPSDDGESPRTEKVSDKALRHNTFSIPLEQILEEEAKAQTRATHSRDKKESGTASHWHLLLRSGWWRYLLLVLLCLGVACAIAVPVIVFGP